MYHPHWRSLSVSSRHFSILVTVALLILVVAPLPGDAQEPQDVEFIAKVDGSQQHYVLVNFPQNTESKERACLIALHGHGSDRWQFVLQDRAEVRATKDFARRHGMVYVSPDYRAPTSWMGPAAEADLLQIIDEVTEKFGIKKLYLCGGSMGGTSALTFAALHPGSIDGVASMNGTANHLEFQGFQEAITQSFGGTKQEIPSEYKQRSAEYWPELFTMPLGLTVGGKDDIVPPDSVTRLAGVLSNLKRPVLFIRRDEGGHDTNYEDATAILEFMLQPLPDSVRP